MFELYTMSSDLLKKCHQWSLKCWNWTSAKNTSLCNNSIDGTFFIRRGTLILSGSVPYTCTQLNRSFTAQKFKFFNIHTRLVV